MLVVVSYEALMQRRGQILRHSGLGIVFGKAGWVGLGWVYLVTVVRVGMRSSFERRFWEGKGMGRGQEVGIWRGKRWWELRIIYRIQSLRTWLWISQETVCFSAYGSQSLWLSFEICAF